MSYAIFRCQSINSLGDLREIGKHNMREKEAYKSNPDIRINDSVNNVELVKCNKNYLQKFYDITKEYREEHNEKMKNIRSDRKKSFARMINDSKSVVADEMIFTSDYEFFENMSKEDILKWANESMKFVYEDLGYTKEQVIHATLHMDEKTPHIHCVVVPLVKKFDKRANREKYSISKREYIKDKEHLSRLQDKYCNRLNRNGFKLERGRKNTGIDNLSVKQLKGVARQCDTKTYNLQKKINNDYFKITNLLNSCKKQRFNTTKVVIDNEVYSIILNYLEMYNNDVKEFVKNKSLHEDLSKQVCSYEEFERRYNNSQKELDYISNEYDNLKNKLNEFKDFIIKMLQSLKQFFRDILLSKNEDSKVDIIKVLKDCYDNNLYNYNDLRDISNNTDYEEEINNLINSKEVEKDYDIFI